MSDTPALGSSCAVASPDTVWRSAPPAPRWPRRSCRVALIQMRICSTRRVSHAVMRARAARSRWHACLRVPVVQRSRWAHRLPHQQPVPVHLLADFGLGSFALSTEILIRFHASIPYETEVQFISGIGHLAEAAVGIALLFPHLRGYAQRQWLSAHNAALAYWTFQIAVLTPPWFAFQGQRELVTTFALGALLVAALVNLGLWARGSALRESSGSVSAGP